MLEQRSYPQEMWEQLPKEEKISEELVRPVMTYQQDAWRRLKKNYLAMIGLATIFLIMLIALIGPFIISQDYATQNLDAANIPLRMQVLPIEKGTNVYVNGDYKLVLVSDEGRILGRADLKEENIQQGYRLYQVSGHQVKLDYTYGKKTAATGGPAYQLLLDEKPVPTTAYKKMFNKSNPLGTDTLGRDMLARLLLGARISLFIAIVSTVVNFFIGVIYGGFSGYIGGRVDNIMMRIVDIINTIPLLLYVILLSVVIGSGLKSIIIAIGSVYWLSMARLVRGQVLALKEQDYVLAARTLGAGTWRILSKHLIPNALGPIIVAITMTIPGAIFTEAFLSFIGLGVNAPMASWGTLASDALGGLRSYPYQIFEPALAICVTMLAFNFLGDGLRDALDPRLRK